MNTVYKSHRKPAKPADQYITKRFGSPRMEAINKRERELVVDFLNSLPKKDSIVDIPCGSGRLLDLYSEFNRVYAIDANESMLLEAKKHPHHQSIEFFLGNIHKIPLEDDSVDGLICMRLLHHIDNQQELKCILTEICRVIKYGALITFYRDRPVRNFVRKLRGKLVRGKPIAITVFRRLCEDSGMKIKRIEKLGRTSQTVLFAQKL